MQISNLRAASSLAVALLLLAAAVRGDDWTTLGADAQRSSWVRSDLKTSPATVRSPEFRFLWRIELSNEARGGNALTAPALLDFLISHRGFRSLAFVGGSSGGVFAMDTDLARMEWERHFPAGSSQTSADCPGGMTSSVTRPTAAPMPSMLGIAARGRRDPASSAVGQPGEGAVTLKAVPPRPVRTPATARPPRTARTRPPARVSLRGVTLVHALSAEGALHSLYASNGRDHVAPVPFLPANANARGLIVSDGFAYVSTSNECGEVPDGVWSLDLESGAVTTWKSDGGAIAGLGGLSFGPDGAVFATTRDGSLVSLEAKSLALKGASQPAGFRSSPVVFDFEGTDHVAALARDGSLRVYAAGKLGSPVASTAGSAGAGDIETAIAAWQDASGTRWILVPSRHSVVAWKMTQADGGPRLEKGWESSRMDAPLPPIVVNGVVFALDGGKPSGSAKLYAFEGTSGDEIWDSGDAIRAPATGHTLASGPGHVFLTASDSAVYAFGFPMEH